MLTITPGTYADLRAGVTMRVVAPTCRTCGTITAENLATHNVNVARHGERSYRVAA